MNKNGLLLALAVTPGLVLAADGMKPGHYSYTMKMEMPGMPMAMPPQNFQRCVTQADIDQGSQYGDQRNKDCEVKNLRQTAGKTTFDLACKDGMTGKAEYSYGGDQMSGKTVMTRDGQPMTMSMSAKRTGDCK